MPCTLKFKSEVWVVTRHLVRDRTLHPVRCMINARQLARAARLYQWRDYWFAIRERISERSKIMENTASAIFMSLIFFLSRSRLKLLVRSLVGLGVIIADQFSSSHYEFTTSESIMERIKRMENSAKAICIVFSRLLSRTSTDVRLRSVYFPVFVALMFAMLHLWFNVWTVWWSALGIHKSFIGFVG